MELKFAENIPLVSVICAPSVLDTVVEFLIFRDILYAYYQHRSSSAKGHIHILYQVRDADNFTKNGLTRYLGDVVKIDVGVGINRKIRHCVWQRGVLDWVRYVKHEPSNIVSSDQYVIDQYELVSVDEAMSDQSGNVLIKKRKYARTFRQEDIKHLISIVRAHNITSTEDVEKKLADSDYHELLTIPCWEGIIGNLITKQRVASGVFSVLVGCGWIWL